MNIIKAMAEQDRALVKNLRLDEKDKWIAEFIRKELQSEGMQYEAVTEALLDHEKSIINGFLDNNPVYIGDLVYFLIRDYMRRLAEKAWLNELDDINFTKD